MAEVQAVKGNRIELLFYASGEASLQLVQKPDNLNLILKVLCEHFRANLSIQFKIDKQKENPNLKPEKPHADSADPEELLESSPRLRMLVDKVDGEIIGVRKTKKQ
jgi:hypothetical protein